MKADKQTSVKLKLNAEEYKMLLEIIEKIIFGESPLHEIGILNKEQLQFLKQLQKIL